MFSPQDSRWMQRALQLADAAEAAGEVPVGAVLVVNDQVVGEGFNCPIDQCDPSAHAEIIALRRGAMQMNNYRLVDSTLYVTLEPCLMCLGAIVHARVKRLVFGAHDVRAGAVESAFNVLATKKLNHHVICEGGLLHVECSDKLTHFFRAKRQLKS